LLEVLRKNYTNLKTIYLMLISGELFPNIGWFEFENFCHDSKMVDKYLSVRQIDQAFIAVNFDDNELEEEDNASRELCRYEFMEILVRIADVKYRQTKQLRTFAEAFDRFLTELFSNFELAEWNEFRTELLWAFDPNLVYELNQNLLKRLFDQLTEVKGPNNKMAW
jgi:hypothetical protein